MSGTDRASVVVGFDGSGLAEDAVRYAVGEAARRGVGVWVVVAHEPPDAWAAGYGLPLYADDGEIRRAVEGAARDRVEQIRRGLDDARRAVPVHVVAVTGRAADVLVREASGAPLLVVGHRGRGRLGSAVLGSVGLSLVLHAPCPVTVVPPAHPPGAHDATGPGVPSPAHAGPPGDGA